MLAGRDIFTPRPFVSCQPASSSGRHRRPRRDTAVHALYQQQPIPGSCSPAQHDRRSILAAAAATASLLIPLPAIAAAAQAEVLAVKELKGKAGFRFQFPEGWVTAFNRKNQSGALALVGDFKSFDTASVLKADLSRLKLPPDTAARGDVKALVRALIDEARSTGSTMSFELVNEGTDRKDGTKYVTFEYVLSICNGEIEEGLEGRRRCLAPSGNAQEPIIRHLVATATFKAGEAYLITASSPADRWPQTADKLRGIAESFHVD